MFFNPSPVALFLSTNTAVAELIFKIYLFIPTKIKNSTNIHFFTYSSETYIKMNRNEFSINLCIFQSPVHYL